MVGISECDRVILITIDSLRRDCLDEMPTLDALATEGVRFKRTFAHSNWTPLSFPSILGPEPVFARSMEHELASPTLAQHLSNRGIDTVGLNAANGFLTEHWGYDRGFRRFESFLKTTGRLNQWLATHPTTQGWVQLLDSALRRPFTSHGDRHTVDTSKLLRLEDELDRVLGTGQPPQFIWMHLMDTHTPYVPAPRHLTDDSRTSVLSHLFQQANASLGTLLGTPNMSMLRDRYHGAARQVDRSLARLVQKLQDRGLAENTALIVAGDHGEEFLEHGHTAHYPKLYRELIEVPLVVSHPDIEPRTVDAPVGLEVIPPTVADLLGVETSPFEGRSVLPALTGTTRTREDPVVSVTVRGESVTSQPIPRSPTAGTLLLSARNHRWTYIYNEETGTEEVYDRDSDPGEQELLPLDEVPPATLDRLKRPIQTRLDRIRGTDTSNDDSRIRPPESVTTSLEHLGYS